MALWIPLSLLLFECSIAQLTTINVVTLIIITIGCLGVATLTVINAPTKLWYPMPWFLLTSSIYYGFGPLLYYLGSPETIAYVDAYYPVNDFLLFRSNILTMVGISGVIAVYMALTIIFSPGISPIVSESKKKDIDVRFLRKISYVFLIVGLPIKIFLLMHLRIGLWEAVLPGSLEFLGVLSTLALVPLSLLSTKRTANYRISFYALLFFEIGAAFLQLSKLEMLKVGIVLVLAGVLRGMRSKQIVLFGIIAFLGYIVILSPLVTYGRIKFNVMGLTKGSEATQLMQDFAAGSTQGDLATILPGVQGWWARLNYANAQAFAMQAYDAKDKGNTFELIIWTLIPRALYPSKPITTVGDRFNELVTGNPESKSAPGMFAEGYWNAGWVGLIAVVLIMALCYWGWERYNLTCLKSLQLHYLPVIWLGLFTAIQQDSWFVPSILGALPIAIVFHWLAKILILRPHFPRKALR